MMVSSSSEIHQYPPSLAYPENIPNEHFIKLTTDGLDPFETIDRLKSLGLLSKSLNKKVNGCWATLLLHSDRQSFYIPFYAEKLNINASNIAELSLSIAKKQYRTLKKWEKLDYNRLDNATPKVLDNNVTGRARQCILNNHLGNPELWIMLGSNFQLERIDLTSNVSCYIDLKKVANPISSHCHPCMARSGKWLAFCTMPSIEKHEINIIHVDSGTELNGKICHTITDLGKIRQLHSENGFLYVLCRDSSEQSKFLRYDSQDWTKQPLELSFPHGNVKHFYISNDKIFFTSIENKIQHELSAINKDICFLAFETDFKRAPVQDNYPILKTMDDVILTLTAAPKSTLINPITMLVVLNLDGSSITKNCFLELPVNVHSVDDFLVVFDRIFIQQKEEWKSSISCFDLNGNLLNTFPPIESYVGTNFRPSLVILPPSIKFYYSSKNRYNNWLCEKTSIQDLNFKKDDPYIYNHMQKGSVILQETVEK